MALTINEREELMEKFIIASLHGSASSDSWPETMAHRAVDIAIFAVNYYEDKLDERDKIKKENSSSDIDDLKSLMKYWNMFLSFFDFGNDLTEENENKFLEIRSRIVILYNVFIKVVTKRDLLVASQMQHIINQATSVFQIRGFSPSGSKNIILQWHEVYLLLDEMIGRLEESKDSSMT